MKKIGVLLVFAFCAAVFGAALAHEQSRHKGRPTEGEVASVSEKGFVLETTKGKVPITVSDTTEFERGDEKVTKKDVHQGDHLNVFGTVLPSGEVVAREVVVHPAGEEGHDEGHGDE